MAGLPISFIGDLPQRIGKLWRHIKELLDRIWDVLTGLGRLVGGAWGDFVRGLRALGGALRDIGTSVYVAVRWLIVEEIPRAVRGILDAAVRVTRRLVDDLARWVRGAIAAAIRTARSLVGELADFARHAIRWLRDHTLWLLGMVRKLADAVFNLLLAPAKLVVWLGGHLVQFILRWILGHGTDVARLLFRSRSQISLEQAEVIERDVARLLGGE